VQQQIAAWRDRNQGALNAKLNALHQDSAALLTQAFSAFLKEVEREAHDNINRTVAAIHRAELEVTNA
jgi:glucose-6-phosphate-specific signal transduction histidine kinase